MKLFVISNKLSSRYDNHNPEDIYEYCWNTTPDLDKQFENFNFKRLKNYHKKLCVISLFFNYISLFEKIIKEKLEDVFILEDDTIYSKNELFEKVKEFNVDGLLYLVHRTYNEKISKGKVKVNFEPGINIRKNYYLSTGGIFIKNASQAQELMNHMKVKNKWIHYAIDIALMRAIERGNLNCYVYSPALIKMDKSKSIINCKNKISAK